MVAASVGDDAVARYGPAIDDDDEVLPADAVPANTRETAIVAATAILLNTGVLLSVRLRTGCEPNVLSGDRHDAGGGRSLMLCTPNGKGGHLAALPVVKPPARAGE